nr:MAG TPA: hypothetical protein [Caudoviricetes sp.]
MSGFFCRIKRLSENLCQLSNATFCSAFCYCEEVKLSNIHSRDFIDLIYKPIYRF